ncbi:MAG TPA: hypothetical protein VE861_13945 [Gemmatimonadaceae bacterium]|nr:hypothetical protein [Gemmatimonadaceae bacterium]
MTNQSGAAVIAGVPSLVALPVDLRPGLPAVIWCHGFRADALAHARELERCAAAGFIAIGIDAVGHGARRDPDLASRLHRSPGGALPVMLQVVDDTVHEMPALLDALVREYAMDRSRVSMVGISMGAFIAYRCIASGIRLRSVIALLGSPERPDALSPHVLPMRFRDVALLSITAEHDASVPPAPVVAFHRVLDADTLRRAPARHHVLRGTGHLTSAPEWDEAMHETLDWLRREGLRRT